MKIITVHISKEVWQAGFKSALLITLLFVIPLRAAQSMQKGVSVEMAVASNAVPMPDADKEDAPIVTIAKNGSLYLGVRQIDPDLLPDEVRALFLKRSDRKLFIKADAGARYADLVRVFDNLRSAGVETTVLLTNHRVAPEPGKPAPPYGLEVAIGLNE